MNINLQPLKDEITPIIYTSMVASTLPAILSYGNKDFAHSITTALSTHIEEFEPLIKNEKDPTMQSVFTIIGMSKTIAFASRFFPQAAQLKTFGEKLSEGFSIIGSVAAIRAKDNSRTSPQIESTLKAFQEYETAEQTVYNSLKELARSVSTDVSAVLPQGLVPQVQRLVPYVQKCPPMINKVAERVCTSLAASVLPSLLSNGNKEFATTAISTPIEDFEKLLEKEENPTKQSVLTIIGMSKTIALASRFFPQMVFLKTFREKIDEVFSVIRKISTSMGQNTSEMSQLVAKALKDCGDFKKVEKVADDSWKVLAGCFFADCMEEPQLRPLLLRLMQQPQPAVQNNASNPPPLEVVPVRIKNEPQQATLIAVQDMQNVIATQTTPVTVLAALEIPTTYETPDPRLAFDAIVRESLSSSQTESRGIKRELDQVSIKKEDDEKKSSDTSSSSRPPLKRLRTKK